MAYNTGNPLGSSSPKDLFDNAETLDNILNQQVSQVTNRFGQNLYTLWFFSQMTAAANAQIAATVSTAQGQVNQARTNGINSINSTVSAANADVAAARDDGISDISDTVTAAGTAVNNSRDAGILSISEKVGAVESSRLSAVEAISEKVDDVNEASSSAATAIADTVTAAGATVNDARDGAVILINGKVADVEVEKTESITSMVSKVVEVEVSKSEAGDSIDALVQNVSDAGDAAEAQMLETAANLGSDLNNKHYTTYSGIGGMLSDPQSRDAVVGVVDADPNPNLNGWYSWSNDSSAWIRFIEQPAMATAVASLIRSLITSDPKAALTFTDDYDMVIAKLMADGSFDMRGAILQGRGAGGLSVTDENGFSIARFDGESSEFSGLFVKSYPKRNGMFFIDDLGFVIGKVANDGVFFGLQSKSAQPVTNAYPVAQLGQQVRTGIMQIVGYGQSLAVGETALPAISTTQPFSNVMMSSGVKSRYQQMGYNPVLVPLIEQNGVSPMPDNQGETPVSGMANGLVRRISQRGQTHTDWCFAAMAAGRAGWSVERLSPLPLGTGGAWEDMVNMIKDMKTQADNASKTYSVWAYSWVQGESNYLDQWVNSQYQYTQYMAQLWDKFTEKVLEITGQSFRPYMFTYQVATHRRYARDWMDIALSQWALSKNRPDVVMAVPCYQFICSPDSIHLTNEQSWLMGEYFGRAMDFTMVRKCGKWRPLEPVSVNWQGDTIDIKYHVPGGRIVIDTTLCTQARNNGFDIRDVADLVIDNAISSVSVVEFDTVRIKLAPGVINQAFRVTYARGIPGDPVASGAVEGPRGNVRDTMGDFDKVTSPLGNEFSMHNASVMYQYDRKNGFF